MDREDDPVLVGVDYGSKLAGTTVAAVLRGGEVTLHGAGRKEDADRFLRHLTSELPIGTVGLDAPLSLPGVYRELPGYRDYHFRQADRLLRGMSPMFLGGLTARATELSHHLQAAGWQVLEVYPGAVARQLPLRAYAKTDRAVLSAALAEVRERCLVGRLLPEGLACESYHALDAVLALETLLRKRAGTAESHGTPEEGLVWV